MTITLSSDDVRRLQAAATALLTPFAHPDIPSWSGEVTRRCAEFLKADQALFGLLTPERAVIFGHGTHTDEGSRSYQAYFWTRDTLVQERRPQLGLEVYHRDMLYRPGEIRRCEVYHDWSQPNRFFDTVGMAVDEPGDPPIVAGIHFFHDSESGVYRDEGVELLQLLLPAFKAGLRAWLTLGERRDALHAALDGAGAGVLVTDLTGTVLHESATLGRLLAADPERGRVHQALIEAAATTGAIVSHRPPWMDVRPDDHRVVRTLYTARARYRLVATHIPEGVVAPQRAVAVMIAVASPRELSNDVLRDRYGLTGREIDVARRIAAGQKNREIADALGVSVHTTLRHTERVLRKIGVHSRAAVAAALLHTP